MSDIKNLQIVTNELHDEMWRKKDITLSLLRLDKIHPVISGNKIFKLHYFLKKAIALRLKIITFGGAYSNHLVATAAACKPYGLQCIGIVRGEKPLTLSATLSNCIQQDMHLEFISREEYNNKEEKKFKEILQAKYGDHILIPEGGFNEEGLRGAAEIYSYIRAKSYTHICCSVGTATTLAGLIQAAPQTQQIIGFSALRKINTDERLRFLLKDSLPENYSVTERYHFGGYAKGSTELFDFMNVFYEKYSIPLDFVYTGKMMFGVTDLIKQKYFAKKSEILCIHTGGLQGNTSLTPGVLKY